MVNEGKLYKKETLGLGLLCIAKECMKMSCMRLTKENVALIQEVKSYPIES